MILKRSIVLLLLILLFVNCWKEQEHEISAPEIPNYTLSGYTYDIDSHDIITNSEVTLVAVDLVYDDAEFVSASDTTDSTGYYNFSNITPGTYSLNVKTGRFRVLSEEIVVDHEDKIKDLKLPKVLIADKVYKPAGSNGNREYPRLHGIHWKDYGTLCGVWLWKDYGDDAPRWRVVAGFFGSEFSIIGERSFRDENPEFWGITYSTNYWVCGGSGFNNKIYIIYPGDGRVSGSIDVPYKMLDLTSDGTNIWGVSANGKAIKFGVHASVVENVYDVENEHPSGIAWDGSNIWTNDASVGYIYQHTNDFGVQTTYIPYLDSGFGNYNVINGIKYLTFDHGGNLWASDEYTVYKFQKP